jgi:hypothetical protein
MCRLRKLMYLTTAAPLRKAYRRNGYMQTGFIPITPDKAFKGPLVTLFVTIIVPLRLTPHRTPQALYVCPSWEPHG